MSDLLDELARSLVTPMHRRGALRTLGGALVAVAVPGALRPTPAQARPANVTASHTVGFCDIKCSAPTPVVCLCKNDRNKGPYAGCFETCGVPGSTCCCNKGPDGFNSSVVACPPGTRCARKGDTSNCPCVNTCGTGCCGKDEFCANPRNRLCCKQGERGCGLECCKPNEECKRIRVGTGSQTFCEKRCPPKQAWCGRNKCCPPKWHCVNESTGLCKRCRRDQEECGTKCCDKATSRCCGEGICCQKGRACCTVDGERICCPPKTKCALQVLSSQSGLTNGSPRVCCPLERFNRTPDLCCPPGQVALNSPGLAIPPPGVNNPFCCPRGQICRSSVTGNPICVDLRSDQTNCGSCGNVCSSGICRGGVCALP